MIWTAYVKFNLGGEAVIEEIDVKAPNQTQARARVKEALAADYQPGGVIKKIAKRMGPVPGWVTVY